MIASPPVVLTIAATDSGGGAGIAADLATFAALGVHGCCVVTAVTAQDTREVHAIHPIPADIVEAQLTAVLDDLDPAVIKTGMLATADTVRLVARRCAGRILVVDPVLRASTGASLADEDVIAAYREHLLPVATVLTPNVDEHSALGLPQGPGIVVTRGAPPAGSAGQRVETSNDHGTGCTFASALAAHLALGTGQGEAVALAHAFVSRQLAISRDWAIGAGRGPVAHIHQPQLQGAEQ
ncbi:MAG TPA: hydroxymethylpyrimidine/phosphomethylpyrimidine kinase [Aeromicrobium sp.]|nr:hydroxymethylpyrimidine/phosphomethylpyrimidine kinase [Aeromicrobium sp.]